MKTKDIKLRLPQLPFFADETSFFDEENRITTMVMAAHRRAGKSVAVALQDCRDINDWLLEDSIYKIRGDVDSSNPLTGFVAPTKVQARGIIWPYYKQFMGGIPGVKFNNSTLSVTVPRPLTMDEITVQLYASKNHDRMRGMKFRKVNSDEMQDGPEAALESSIKPALKDSQGRLNVTGTAKGMDYFYQMICNAIQNGHPVYLFPVTSTGVFTPEEIEDIRKDCMGGSFEREYMLDFTAKLDGVFFHDKIESLRKMPWFNTSSDDPGLVNAVGVDIGVAEGFAAWTAKLDYENNLIHIQDYYEGYTHLLEFKNDMDGDDFRPDVIFLPHDGKTRTIGRAQVETPKKMFRDIFPEAIIKVNKRTPELMVDIARVNEHLHLVRMPPTELGTDAHRGLSKLGEFRRKQDKLTGAYMDAIDKSTGVDHAADAMRCLMAGLDCRNGLLQKQFTYKRTDERRSMASDTEEGTPWTKRPSRQMLGYGGVYKGLMDGLDSGRSPWNN